MNFKKFRKDMKNMTTEERGEYKKILRGGIFGVIDRAIIALIKELKQ